MLSRLGEQRYAPSQEGRAVEGGTAGGATWWEPPQLSVWTQGHWLTLGPYSHSSDLHAIPAILGGGHHDSHFSTEQWWCQDLLGSESQTEWG